MTYDQHSLSFAPPFATANDTGVFSGFSGGTVNYLLGTVTYTDGWYQTEEVLTITSKSGNTLAFYADLNSPTKTLDAAGNLALALDETGYYTFNGGPAMAGTFDLTTDGTSPDGASSNVDFNVTGALLDTNASAAVTPEPSSIALLGTGLLGCAAWVRGRRRHLS